MRIGVIGAGAVGGTLAALLDRAGHDVEVTARGAHLAAIREGGIRLSGAWGEHVARVEANSELTHAPELAVLATKAQDAVAALRGSARLLTGIPLVVVQNGLTGLDTALEGAPRATIVGALALFAASHLAPGEIVVTAAGSLVLGGDETSAGLGSLLAARTLADAMPVSIAQDFRGAQWTKLVVNQVNALPAITGMSAQEVIAHRGLRMVMTESIRETIRVALGSHVRFARMQGLSHRMLRLALALPPVVTQLLPLALARRMGSVPNPGSTLQSIHRGQATEIDHLNGAVVAAGLGAGVATPVNAALVGLVHEVEASGDFVAVDAVLAAVAARRSERRP